MDRLIYTALTGMTAAMDRQRVVANNLANATTTGFRAEKFAVTPITLKGGQLEVRSMAQGAVHGADMASGTVRQTGQPLDIALGGDALMALQGADGGEVYTRRCDLRVASSGVLENGDGLPVLGQGEPITVPLGAQLSIAEDGAVLARDPATPDLPPQEVARIKLASPQGSALLKDIDGFLRVPGGGVLPDDPTARVVSGALEGSNVDTATTLVQMVEAQRAFEQRARILTTANELSQSGARLMSLRG